MIPRHPFGLPLGSTLALERLWVAWLWYSPLRSIAQRRARWALLRDIWRL